MARVVNAPSNPFRRSIMGKVGGTGGGSTGTGGGSSKTDGYGNPMMGDLGNPAMHQTFSGNGSSVAQFGQTLWQDKAFRDQQKAIGEAQQAFSDKLGAGMPLPNALMDLMKEDGGKHFMALSGSGMLDKLEKFQLFQQQAQMMSQVGQTQTIDFGGGNKMGMVIGPDGKPHYMNMPGPAAQNAATNRDRLMQPMPIPGIVDDNGNPGVRQGGQIGSLPGFKPTSRDNADAGRQFKLDNPNLGQKPFYNRQSNTLIYPGVDGAPPTEVPVSLPTVKLNIQDNSFLSVMPNMDRAMGQLIKLAPQVASPLTGKISTVAGKLTGGDPASVAWNAAMGSLRTSVEQDRSSYTGEAKRILSELPSVWNDPNQFISSMQQLRGDLKGRTERVVSNAEGNGLISDKISNDLAPMGIFTRKFEPVMNKIKNNPDDLTMAEIDALTPHKDSLPPELADVVRQQLVKKMQQTSEQSVPPTGKPIPLD